MSGGKDNGKVSTRDCPPIPESLFFGHECSDLGVDGWVSTNLNVVITFYLSDEQQVVKGNRGSKLYVFFFGHGCSDSGVDGWVSTNPNIVPIRICKTVRIIGCSLKLICCNNTIPDMEESNRSSCAED